MLEVQSERRPLHFETLDDVVRELDCTSVFWTTSAACSVGPDRLVEDLSHSLKLLGILFGEIALFRRIISQMVQGFRQSTFSSFLTISTVWLSYHFPRPGSQSESLTCVILLNQVISSF